jgi:DNA-binding IclR family transcriptional regulator
MTPQRRAIIENATGRLADFVRRRDGDAGRSDRAVTNPVARTMYVLQHLAAAPEGLGVSELAAGMRVNKAIAFRILASLQAMGFVEKAALTQRYRLTLKLASLAFALIDSLGLEDICQPFLDRLADETGELVQLAVVDGRDLIFVAKAQGNQRVKVTPLLGRRAALHASAGGKVWLSSLPEERAIEIAIAHGLSALTPKTLTTVEQLRQEWERVRGQGYATVIGEYWMDVNSVGAPVRVGRQRQVVAAVSVAGPASRFTEECLRTLAPSVIEVADATGAVWPRVMVVADLEQNRHE